MHLETPRILLVQNEQPITVADYSSKDNAHTTVNKRTSVQSENNDLQSARKKWHQADTGQNISQEHHLELTQMTQSV